MVLRVRPTEKTKRAANLSIVDEEEKRPKSVKKPKPKQKKKSGKIDAKKPKKPPTAFFFFLYVPLLLPFIWFPNYNYCRVLVHELCTLALQNRILMCMHKVVSCTCLVIGLISWAWMHVTINERGLVLWWFQDYDESHWQIILNVMKMVEFWLMFNILFSII